MTHLALLRAINVAGHKPVPMANLRDLLTELGFTNVRTLLQSGNVLFDGAHGPTAQIERQLENEAAKRLALQTDFFVRTPKEWAALVSSNPFPAEAKRDPSHLVVMVLRQAPKPGGVAGLQETIDGPEIIRAHRREAYIVYPDGIGRSRLTSARIEAKLGTRGTARNWNTVMKLAAMAAPSR